jgi:hypothetical protein
MDRGESRAASPGSDLLPPTFPLWMVFVALLVVGGLALSANAGDAYMAVAGLMFAGFGLVFGFRLLSRVLP